jgi:tetratricopeptide (TPR) repeat protein
LGLAGLALARLADALPGDEQLDPQFAHVLRETTAGQPADRDLLQRGEKAAEVPGDCVVQLLEFLPLIESVWLPDLGSSDGRNALALLSHFASQLPADRQETACDVLRCVFGGVVRPAPLDPSWLTANDSAVAVLARDAEAADRSEVMPILGDALEDAGCTDEAILGHCRSAGAHARGCWLVAALLGEPEWTEARKYGVAVNYWSLRLCCDGDDQHALAQRGFAFSKIGRHDELIEDMDVLLALNPTYAWALRTRGYGYQARQQYEAALLDFNRAIELDPNDAWTHALIGYACTSLGRFDQALASLDRAIELDPSNGWARGDRGFALLKRGDYARAIDDFTYALEHCEGHRTDPDRPWAQAKRGHLYLVANQLEKSLGDRNSALDDPRFAASSDYHWAYAQRASAYLKLADYRQAARDFAIAAQHRTGLNMFAWALATSPDDTFRDGKRAVEYASRACEVSSWEDADDIDTLAAAHAEVGDFPQAVRLQEQALALGLLDDEARRRLDLYREGRPYRTP